MTLLAGALCNSGPRIGNGGRTFAVRGWDNPHPILAHIDPDQVDALRSRIAVDIGELLPRCEKLDASLPQPLRERRSYRSSRAQKRFDLLVEPVRSEAPAIPARIDPAPSIRHTEVPARADDLDALLVDRARIVCVGVPLEGVLQSAVGSHDRVVTTVESGDGLSSSSLSGQARPSPNSLAAWMALNDEAERATVSIFILTRMAAAQDVELLRHRLYPHQHILVEAGSPALTWLLAIWGPTVSRAGDVFVFSEPDRSFQAPYNRARLSADEPWPRVSVVTVSYNQYEFLDQCLRSVLDQRYPNLEYIVVDAGSTDGSAELLRNYQARHNCFSHLIIEPDHGQSDGLNKGFRLATGDILTWVNSDDMLAPLSLKRAAMALRETGADMVAGSCRRIVGAKTTPLYKHFAALPTLQPQLFTLDAPLNWCESWEKGDWFFQPEVVFTREIWERAGGYLKPHLFWAMDWDLWLRFALAGARVVRIPDVMGASREHASQKTTGDELYLWQVVGILREYDELLRALDDAASGFGNLGK
jgi:GT2 family glycosyltransferase